jgi:multidrug resistance efflux pump
MIYSENQSKLLWALILLLGFSGFGLSRLQADVAVSLVAKSVLGSGNYIVSSEVVATIAERFVAEGDAIDVGQSLMALSSADIDDEVAALAQEMIGQQDILQSKLILKGLYLDEFSVIQELFNSQLISAGELRDAERAFTIVEAEVIALQGKLKVLSAQKQRLLNQRKKYLLKASQPGRVLNILKKTPGEVVQIAEPLMIVVPDHGELFFEAKVPVSDISSVKVGSDASISLVSVNRYEVQPFKGKVVYVSAAVEEDEEGNLFFGSKIALDADQKNRADAVHLQDIGQLAEISVKAGQRSVLAYLLSPLVRGSETIFTEK